MKAGKLRHWITIQVANKEPNEHGQLIEAWRDFWSGNASVSPTSGSESFSGKQTKATATHRIETRFVDGVTPKMRIKFGSRTLNIESAIDPDERGIELVIMATEIR